jgi:hypothetical protein
VIHSYPPPVSLGSSQSAFAYGASVSALLAVNAKGGRCASELPRAAGCGSPHADPRVVSAEGSVAATHRGRMSWLWAVDAPAGRSHLFDHQRVRATDVCDDHN